MQNLPNLRTSQTRSGKSREVEATTPPVQEASNRKQPNLLEGIEEVIPAMLRAFSPKVVSEAIVLVKQHRTEDHQCQTLLDG